MGSESSPPSRESRHRRGRIESAPRRLLVGAYPLGLSMVRLGSSPLVAGPGQTPLSGLAAAANSHHHPVDGLGAGAGQARILLDWRDPSDLRAPPSDVRHQPAAHDAGTAGRSELQPQYLVAWPFAV